MKKMTMMMGAALLAGGVLAGCSDAEPETKEETVQENETAEEAQTEEKVNEGEAELEQATEEVKEESKQLAEETKENAEALGTEVEEKAGEVKQDLDQEQGEEATGTFNGVADPHTVEIEVDGQPTAYQVDPDSDVMKKFNEMQGGEEITFVYKKEGESMTIVELKE